MLDLKLTLMMFLMMFDPAVLLALKTACAFVLGDTVIAWILALAKGQFDIRQVPKFLQTGILPYLGSLFVLAILTVPVPDYKPVFYFICLIVSAKFGVEAVKDKLTQFFKPAQPPPVDSGDKTVTS